jgi:hypothetical protein
MDTIKIFIICLVLASLHGPSQAQDQMLWGNAVPENWTGNWPDELRTAGEKSGFTHTANNQDILEYFAMLMWESEYLHVFNMFVSDRGHACPVLVMANPRVTSAEEARESGKPVIYLQGGIHPGEGEGKEALLILVRDILFGDKQYLLDELIIMVVPNFNVDGNETRTISQGVPQLTGVRQNALGFDINRDAIKLETTNMRAAYTQVFNTWDPVLIYDTHRMGRVTHGYPIVYAGSNVPAAHKGVRDYVTYRIFPAITEGGRENGQIEIFFHAGFNRDEWPPTQYTHDNAIWSTEGKFMVSGYGLRNRMAILVETVAYINFEKQVYSQYVCAYEALRYSYAHGREMVELCRRADEEVVNNILRYAGTGGLMNYVAGEYVSEGKFDILGYETIEQEFIPGTSVRRVKPELIDRAPDVIPNVELVTKPVGTRQAAVPRGYLIPAELGFLAEKLRILGLEVEELEEPVQARGEEFVITKLSHVRSGGYDMTVLNGAFAAIESKTLPAGTFHLDMAQPLANKAFYALEPEVGDGFIGWNLLDDYFRGLGVHERSIVYPVFKVFELLEPTTPVE